MHWSLSKRQAGLDWVLGVGALGKIHYMYHHPPFVIQCPLPMSSQKRSSDGGENLPPAKQGKTGNDFIAGDNCAVEPPVGPPSLATLACRAVETYFRALRDELWEHHRKTPDVKKTNSWWRQHEPAAAAALVHMSVAPGGPNRYCGDCEQFHLVAEDKCSVSGCEHTCECYNFETPFEMFYEKSTIPGHFGWYENNVMRAKQEAQERGEVVDKRRWPKLSGHPGVEPDLYRRYRIPSKTGYTKCWICSVPFCNFHFEEHYITCRVEADQRCGFRPPMFENDDGGHVCVPGHCGKKLKESEMNICYDSSDGPASMMGVCGTVCCEECADRCQRDAPTGDYDGLTFCLEVRCKQHKDSCYGPCNGY